MRFHFLGFLKNDGSVFGGVTILKKCRKTMVRPDAPGWPAAAPPRGRGCVVRVARDCAASPLSKRRRTTSTSRALLRVPSPVVLPRRLLGGVACCLLARGSVAPPSCCSCCRAGGRALRRAPPRSAWCCHCSLPLLAGESKEPLTRCWQCVRTWLGAARAACLFLCARVCALAGCGHYWLATNFIHMFIHVAHSHHTILQCHHIDFLLISEYYPECPCSLVV